MRAKGLRGSGRWGLSQLCFSVVPGVPWGSASGIPKSRVLQTDIFKALMGKAKSTGKGDTGCLKHLHSGDGARWTLLVPEEPRKGGQLPGVTQQESWFS